MKLLIFSALLTILCSSTALAQSPAGADLPLHISSDAMVSDQASSTVEFTGNVVAKREDGTIRADHIKLFFKEKEKPRGENKQNLERIEASGGVVYETGERKAFADRAVYTIADEVLVLTGKNTRVVTGGSHVTGSTITLYQKSGKVIVEGGSDQRVEMLLNPGELRKNSGD